MLVLIAGFAVVLRSVLSMPDQGHTWFVGKPEVGSPEGPTKIVVWYPTTGARRRQSSARVRTPTFSVKGGFS
jgi:hypothetical protein